VVLKNLATLKDAGGSYFGGGSTVGLGSGWGVMFGDFATNVSQEFGMTAFAAQNMNGMYAYASSYGVNGHPGVDVAMPRGSALRSPSSGTVIRSGGSGYYCDTSGCGADKGELKIKLDNGDEIILGHMSQISVAVGQKVGAGQVVGLTGTQNGDHVHVEYRTPDSSTASGWRAIDPRGGSGVSGEVYQQPVQLYSPMAFMNPAVPMPFAIPSYAKFGFNDPVNYLQQWKNYRSGGQG
jgi:murein DD-endopeptidase MepM/ murein hydrolase activator NlpD